MIKKKDFTKSSMKMETFLLDVTMKTVKNMDFMNISMKIKTETLRKDVTGKTVLDMDFLKNSMKMETFI
jgi:hypothetical protein